MKCKNCKYFESIETREYYPEKGICRRNVPQPITTTSLQRLRVEGTQSSEMHPSNSSYFEFPEITGDDWCGEFKLKPAAKMGRPAYVL